MMPSGATTEIPLAELPLEERTVSRALARSAEKFGDRIAIASTAGDSISFKGLHDVAHRVALGVAALGIERQEPVLTMLPDTIDFIRLTFGLAVRGAIEVPVNLAYRGSILSHISNDSTAKTLVVDQQYLERFDEIADDLTHLQRCIVYSETAEKRPKLPPKLARRCSALGFEEIFAREFATFDAVPTFHDLNYIIYTSGTTGPSKGVMVTHAHAFAHAVACANLFALNPEDVFYSSGLPLFHAAGKVEIIYGSLIFGARVVLRRGFSVRSFWTDIRAHDCTMAFLLGAMGNLLWRQPETPEDSTTSLRKVTMFPVTPEHEEFAKRFGVEICTGYGATESGLPLAHDYGEPLPSPRCVGRPSDRFDVRIFDEHDREVPVGMLGEICLRPRYTWEMAIGYWQRPDATAKTFRNCWYHSGDAGYRDEEGRFYFVDRLTDSMRRRGENISSMEVEDEINSHPQVLECAVFPVPAEEGEQEVMAAIGAKPGETIDPAELTRYLNTRMPYFMVPRYIDFVEELPKTPTGKIQKFPLRQRGVTSTTWDRVAAGVELKR